MNIRKRPGGTLLAAAGLAIALIASPGLAGAATVVPSPTIGPIDPGPVPKPGLCHLITFDAAQVVVDRSGQVTLVVSGYAPNSGTTVKLVPLVYIRQPEYWGIQVIGCSSRITLPVLTPYTVKADVTGSIGTIGIEVIGSGKTLQIPIVTTKGAR